MDRSANMRAIRSKDTKPEKIVRSMLHKLGYRFRFHRRDLPGQPDIVFAFATEGGIREWLFLAHA